MSSSSSLSAWTAKDFANNYRGKADYRGDTITHAVVFAVHRGANAPIMDSNLSHYAGSFGNERESVLPRDAKYRITKRTKAPSGHIVIHLEQL